MDAIVVEELTKRFGAVLAVDRLSFSVGTGRVTGFLGPNGAGKTTTLRILLGLLHPTAGSALVNGRRYADLPDPVRQVGAVLEATSFHPGRRARDHLRIMATIARLPLRRVDDTLDRVGLADAGHRRVGGFSLACASGWDWPRRCSATPGSSSSTSRRTVSTPTACAGCGR